jgi:cAMP phosphodiesterase
MKIDLVPSSVPDAGRKQFLSTFLLNGTASIDAGALGILGSLEEQLSIQHVFLTHSHADHVASLPIFLENTAHRRDLPIRVYGHADTVDALRCHVFNDRIWPTLARLNGGSRPLVELVILEPEQAVLVEGLTIRPVLVHHTIPTFGYLVEEDRAAVVFGADSGPTERIWDLGVATKKLRGAFLECTYPETMTEHAERTGHLTPALLAGEAAKLPSEVRVVTVHIRPAFRERVESEIGALHDPNIEVACGDESYLF